MLDAHTRLFSFFLLPRAAAWSSKRCSAVSYADRYIKIEHLLPLVVPPFAPRVQTAIANCFTSSSPHLFSITSYFVPIQEPACVRMAHCTYFYPGLV